MTQHPILPAVSQAIWDEKYRFKSPDGALHDATLADTWWRVADAASSVEPSADRERWRTTFFEHMSRLEVLPAGRIIAGAGTQRQVTLFNCFVMGPIADDLGGIFDSVKEAALTLQQGGGIGHDFSTLRPKGALVRSVGADASGPVSFMDVWDAMCRTIMSAGARRGAMMGTMRCDHPDIEAFIDAKSDPARLRNFNMSVLVTDAFLAAVRADQPFDLVFGGKVFRTVRARDLWDRIMRATYEYAEPGVIFIDRINAMNNLAYCEEIAATNPCGEQPLPPYGACLLGSINLARLIDEPFEPGARLDEAKLARSVGVLVRLLDNVIDVSGYPLPQQAHEAKAKRRIGIGITGLADALVQLGVRYGSPDAVRLAGQWMASVQRAAYLASAQIAAEKGPFPLFDRDAMLARPNLLRLDADVRAAIERKGLRNGCLTSVAPTGTISLLAGNVSSGVEPVFDYIYRRRILDRDGTARQETIEDYAHALYRSKRGPDAPLTSAFVTAGQLTPHEHLAMQAAVQAHCDSSISKTINCPVDIPFDTFRDIYLEAYDLGLKGCTTFRPNAVTGSVLAALAGEAAVPTTSGGPGGSTSSPAPVEPAADTATTSSPTDGPRPVVYMSKPLERDAALAGYTYKLKWPGSDHALYVTINDMERDGRRRPFEIFINTKNLEHYAWTVALTRMISAVFRRGGDVAFVVEELKAVFDPGGGHWVGGRYVPSLIAAIGDIIETHMVRIGFLKRDAGTDGERLGAGSSAGGGGEPRAEHEQRRSGRPCPRCGSATFSRIEGCWVCQTCGYARCS